jgi:hypothetical protein
MYIFARVFIGLVLNGMVIGAAIVVQQTYFPKSRYPYHQQWLITVLLFWAAIVLITLALGIFGAIRLRYAFICVVVLCIFVIWTAILNRKDLRQWREIRFDLRIPGATIFEHGLLFVGVALLIVLAAVNFVSPPANWDSLNYHLAFPVEWYQSERLTIPIMGFGDVGPSYYPINSSLLYLWLILPFGNLAIADVGQAPFVAVLAMAVYALGRALNLPPRAALWGSLLTLFMPMALLNGAFWSYNDVSFAALWILTLVFGLSFAREPQINNAALCGITLGLFIGTKGFAVLFSITALPFIVWGLYRSIIGRGLSYTGQLFIIGIMPIILLGSFSYLRNFIVTGNPLFPYVTTLPILGELPGVLRTTMFKMHPFHQFSLFQLPIQPGYAPLWFLLALSLPLAGHEIIKNRLGRRVPLLLLMGLVVVYLALFIFMLPIRDVRFLIAPHALLALLCASCLSPTGASMRMFTALLIIATIVALMVIILSAIILMDLPFNPAPLSSTFTIEVWGQIVDLAATSNTLGVGLFQYAALILISSLLLWPLKAILKRGIGLYGGGLIAVALCSILAIGSNQYDLREYYAYNRGIYGILGPAWRWVNANTSGETIVMVGTNAPLPLYGHHLKNSAFFVSATRYDTIHALGRSGVTCAKFSCDRDWLDEQAWRRRVEDIEVDYIFVLDGPDGIWSEEEWMRAAPETFSIAFERPGLRIWRVLDRDK